MIRFTSGELLAVIVIGAVAGGTVTFHAERNKIKHSSLWGIAVFFFLWIPLPFYALHVRRVRRKR